jgi:hypothetical protein
MYVECAIPVFHFEIGGEEFRSDEKHQAGKIAC